MRRIRDTFLSLPTSIRLRLSMVWDLVMEAINYFFSGGWGYEYYSMKSLGAWTWFWVWGLELRCSSIEYKI